MLWLEIKLINPLPKYRKAEKFKLSFFDRMVIEYS